MILVSNEFLNNSTVHSSNRKRAKKSPWYIKVLFWNRQLTKNWNNIIFIFPQGKGTIYVWATGNGGHALDHCSCDGYTSSIYTLSVGSISPGGYCTGYDEKCPSTMGVVYTGDVGEGKREHYGNLVTTSLFNECVVSFSGTSCAAPLAAGIVALVLQARPELTWRDMQHLVVETAIKNDPSSSSWNKVKLRFVLA